MQRLRCSPAPSTPVVDLLRRVSAEALGTGLLVATVVGSGIMARHLTGDAALMLLVNAMATAAILVVLIAILAPVSGAHLNPAVTLALALRKAVPPRDAAAYTAAQIAGGVAGTVAAHAMFNETLLQLSTQSRGGAGQWLAEAVATAGLVLAILLARRRAAIPWLVGLYIFAAYWFTSSTSFANPAVTIARALTDTFAGIGPVDVPAFVLAQLIGAAAGTLLAAWLRGDPVLRPSVPSEPEPKRAAGDGPTRPLGRAEPS